MYRTASSVVDQLPGADGADGEETARAGTSLAVPTAGRRSFYRPTASYFIRQLRWKLSDVDKSSNVDDFSAFGSHAENRALSISSDSRNARDSTASTEKMKMADGHTKGNESNEKIDAKKWPTTTEEKQESNKADTSTAK